MTFIPVGTQLLAAVNSYNADKVEELLLNSDSKRNLILEHIAINGKESLADLLPRFKSQGLVSNIKALLNIEE